MKKLLSVVLSVIVIFSLSVPSLAAGPTTEETYLLDIGDGASIELEIYSHVDSNTTWRSFRSIQYYNGEIVQAIDGVIGEEQLRITNYENGVVASNSTANVSERIKCDTKYVTQSLQAANAGQYGALCGSITYNEQINNEIFVRRKEVADVYSQYNGSEYDQYVINAKAGDTINFWVGVILSIGGAILTARYEMVGIIVAGVIGAAGGVITGGIVQNNVTETVDVTSMSYTMTAVHRDSGRTYTSWGDAMQVISKGSSRYNEWYYTGTTPRNWKNDDYARDVWNNCVLVMSEYPGVFSYS